MQEEVRRSAGFQLDDERWESRLSEVVEFVHEHHRLPVQSSGAPAAERRLSYWLSNQRAEFKSLILVERRAAALDGRLPGWRSAADWRHVHEHA